ncbi:GumL protein [Geminocystis sp. NIES-3708]|uniref:polysaccharide pyruvyl transferase family protein n=1 Tax=Geminocystis sp. NIES-3708 TaxID=1615909 RepID=UPI0005FC7289|nr:polysaccharide pyruvyl transferase family protein [Geminocystis sp. NIES-3708]BAQ62829.1 GumL protein [Geminocystis sp. NIES-3708]
MVEQLNTQAFFPYLKNKLRIELLKSKYSFENPLWNSIWASHINFLWFETKNWGDALNPMMIELISGVKARGIDINLKQESDWKPNLKGKSLYLVIGSTLHHADSNTIVWGSGFTSQGNIFVEKPKEICAVRGLLSAKLVRKLGVNCPDVYGDPALLLPRFYQPKVTSKYKLGIIPHFLDWHDPKLKKFYNQPDVLLINIKDSLKKVVRNICSCEKIVSSSLHGLIASDAYGIPSGWIRLSDKIPGKNFKFQDYFSSLGLSEQQVYTIQSDTTISQLYNLCQNRSVNIDLDRLMEVCPFR